MNDDVNFSKRNALNAEKAQLMSSLSANTSSIGDWKIAKIQEARMMGEADPYDVIELSHQRRAARQRINEIEIELKMLDGIQPTAEEMLALIKAEKQNAITEHDNSANVNSFVINNTPMWLSWEQRARLLASVDAIEADGGDVMTKKFGGVEYTFPTIQWRAMITAVENYAGQCQSVTEGHRIAVEALVTEDQVKEYDYTTGYPEKINFDEMFAV